MTDDKKNERVEPYEHVGLWVKRDGKYIKKVTKVARIKLKFSEYQQRKLKAFWQGVNGLNRLTDSFIRELHYYMDTTPELITDSNKRIETTDSKYYKDVAEASEKLKTLLAKIPDIDRLNILSVREERQEHQGKSLPIYDPFLYVENIKNRAEHHSYELKKYVKYEQQWKGLDTFIKRFPPCKNLDRKQLKDLFCILYQPETESLKKAIRNFR